MNAYYASYNPKQMYRTIPFDEETCDAIDEYVRNGRPKSDDDHIFHRAVWPYKKLSATPWQIIAKYAIPLFDRQPNRQYGFHSLRRGLGQQMLEAQIPASAIRDVFGHTTRHSPDAICQGLFHRFPQNSLKCYIWRRVSKSIRNS